MIIVDTSIWVDQIRGFETPLDALLGETEIVIHPFVVGELLLNGLPKVGGFSASAFAQFAQAPVALSAEVAAFIEWARLAGTGIGYVDTHLLVSAKLLRDGKILTQDKNLHTQAKRLGLAYAE